MHYAGNAMAGKLFCFTFQTKSAKKKCVKIESGSCFLAAHEYRTLTRPIAYMRALIRWSADRTPFSVIKNAQN